MSACPLRVCITNARNSHPTTSMLAFNYGHFEKANTFTTKAHVDIKYMLNNKKKRQSRKKEPDYATILPLSSQEVIAKTTLPYSHLCVCVLGAKVVKKLSARIKRKKNANSLPCHEQIQRLRSPLSIICWKPRFDGRKSDLDGCVACLSTWWERENN